MTGFMNHATITNRRDRAQREARREKFDGNHSDKTTLKLGDGYSLNDKRLSDEQIHDARKALRTKLLKSKRRGRGIFIISVLITLFLGIYLFQLFYSVYIIGK